MSNLYQAGIKAMSDGTFDYLTSTMKCALVTSSYTYDADHDFFDDVNTWEITNTGYTAGGNTLASKAINLDNTNNEAEYDSGDVTFTSLAAGDQPYAAIIYYSTGTASTSNLLAYCPLTSPPAPDGNNYQILPTDGTDSCWFKIAA